jgi:2-oxo-4-hydroxy-4-carboxy--5-ureidoimidazoline (OHCU) decarboxylase
LFEAARRVAHDMPAAEQVELVDAHPRLGAPPARMSAMSVEEQARGDRPAGAAATEAATLAAAVERSRLAAELDRLNAAYEARFGFRYCVFVAGRTLAELLPGIAASLEADRASELARAIDAVVDIARDRAGRLGGATTRRIE